MASYTQHYQLHQWEPSDNFLRTDFNDDFKKIDTAIKTTEQRLRAEAQENLENLNSGIQDVETLAKSKCTIVTGSYTGDGQAERVVSLGFTPVWILSFASNGQTGYQGLSYGGLAMPGKNVVHGTGFSLEIVNKGIRVGYDFPTSRHTNIKGQLYYYIACKE